MKPEENKEIETYTCGECDLPVPVASPHQSTAQCVAALKKALRVYREFTSLVINGTLQDLLHYKDAIEREVGKVMSDR
ncbi:MAG TPA: hypothetical protein VF717_09510 [Pyrinomonadaceae bacterium]|jgi:hypothetical protein